MTRVVAHFTDSPNFGGAENEILHLLGGLGRQQWRPILFHHPYKGLQPLLKAARDLQVETEEVPPMPLGLRGARHVRSFATRLRATPVDVFHAHLTWPLACKWAMVGAAVARVPVKVATLQLFVDAPYSYPSRMQHRLIASTLDAYIAVSHHTARKVQRTFGIRGETIYVVYNAVPASQFNQPSNERSVRGQADSTGQPTVLTVARLDEQKGHQFLLQAAPLVPDAHFLLAGDGPERRTLERLVSELNLEDRVSFLGFRSDVSALLARCDVFVLPSLYEGLPLSVVEAMASGKPVIATAIGGTDEAIVDGVTGLLVPPGDPQALAMAIRRVLDSKALATALGNAGRERAHREFSVEVMVQKVTAIYQSATTWEQSR